MDEELVGSSEYYGICSSCGAPLQIEDDELCEGCYEVSECQTEENIIRPIDFNSDGDD